MVLVALVTPWASQGEMIPVDMRMVSCTILALALRAALAPSDKLIPSNHSFNMGWPRSCKKCGFLSWPYLRRHYEKTIVSTMALIREPYRFPRTSVQVFKWVTEESEAVNIKKDSTCRKLPHAMEKSTISPTVTLVMGQTKKICLCFKIVTITKTILGYNILWYIVKYQLVHYSKTIERTKIRVRNQTWFRVQLILRKQFAINCCFNPIRWLLGIVSSIQ